MSMKVIYRNKLFKSKSKRNVLEVPAPLECPMIPEGEQKAEASSDGIFEEKVDPNFINASSDYDDSFHSETGSDQPGDSLNLSEAAEIHEKLSTENVQEDEPNDHRCINQLILEYLDYLGLEETCNSFKAECTSKAIPFPVKPSITDFQKDIEAFLYCFDNWDAEGLEKLWIKIFDEERESSKFRQVSNLLQIFIASLSFRKNENAERKRSARESLREYFQTNSEESTKDPICLQLFGFPFVENPDQHPVFKAIFTDEWTQDLRKKLEELLAEHMNRVTGSSSVTGASRLTTCTLQKMFDYYVLDSGYNLSDRAETTSRGDAPASGTLKARSDICSYVRHSLRQTQERYCKLLNATTAVVSALEMAVQGKAQDVCVLETKLLNTFPELFDRKTVSNSVLPAKQLTSNPTTVVPEVKKEEVNVVETVGKQVVPEVPQVVEELAITCETSQPVEKPIVTCETPQTVEKQAVTCDTSQADERPLPVTCNPNSETDWFTDEDFSDVDTDVELMRKAGKNVDGGQGQQSNDTKVTSNTSTPRIHHTPGFSARASRKLIGKTSKHGSEVTLTEGGGDSIISLKLTDSKANTRIIENSEEIENEDQEIPVEFSQYFDGISPRKISDSCVKITTSLMPPTLSSRFPTPPKTYVVPSSPHLKRMYIPSSLEVGCSSNSSNNATARDSIASRSSSRGQPFEQGSRSSSRGQASEEEEMTPCSSRSHSPAYEEIESQEELEPDEVKGHRKRWDHDPGPISRHLLPQHVTQDTQLLGTRMLTPPPEKKQTSMASIMGVSNPPSPLSNNSPQSEIRKNQLQSLKRLQAEMKTSEKTKINTQPRPTPAVGTGPIYTRKSLTGSKGQGHVVKKYGSESQAHGYGRVYKINHKGPSPGGKGEEMSPKSVKVFSQVHNNG